jgi:protein subunit release factor B
MSLGRGWQVPTTEVSFSAIRAQGAGGQNVNKFRTITPSR